MPSIFSADWRNEVNAELAAKQALVSQTGQIKFPATQIPSSDLNTLDDYEEGSFTPTIQGITTAGAGTYTAQVGTYTKIGRLVYFRALVQWTAHTGTGGIRLAGLPFTASDQQHACSIYADGLTFGGQLGARVNITAATCDLLQTTSGAGLGLVNMDAAALIIISGTYEAT